MIRRIIRYAIFCIILLALLVLFVLRKPLLDRQWDPDVAILAQTEQTTDGFTITDARNWTYTPGTVESQNYFNQTYLYDDLESATFYLQPLDSTGLIAHTFVVFDFGESYGLYRRLGISVETRREDGEQYSIIGGLFNKFELTHTWATEMDLTSRRTIYYDYALIPYDITVSHKEQVAILKEFISQTHNLATKPQFYNTALRNCTNVLAQYINQIQSGAIPYHLSFIFTGLSARYLERLGYISPQ